MYFFSSSTSGEKQFEEFYTEGERIDRDRFRQLGVICDSPRKSAKDIDVMFAKLTDLFRDMEIDKAAIVELIADFIPNFRHIETGRSLDQKM